MTDQLRILIREIIGLVTHPGVDSSPGSENPEGEGNDQENSEETPSK